MITEKHHGSIFAENGNEGLKVTYINRLIEVLNVGDRLEHLPSALSGGQQQRIAIARALANKPSILFADESTGNLDAKNGREVLALLKYVAKEFGITLILVTHDLHVAEQADRIITIEDGRIIRDTKQSCASIVNNSLTAQIRENKKMIGTMRAVGASIIELTQSYIRQLFSMFAWGKAAMKQLAWS